MDELFYGVCNVVIYFIIAVTVVFLLRILVTMPNEVFRKILHFVLLGSIYVWTISFDTWWIEVVSVLGFVIIVYPILVILGHLNHFSEFTTERKKGELKSSLVIVFLMFAIVISIAQGLFHDRYLTLASIYAWGVGDAFAALVGKRFGKHKINGKYLSGKKSVEGTVAMFISSLIAVMDILIVRGGLNIIGIIITSVVTAAVSSVCELYSKNGLDTLTCPLFSLGTLICFLSLFGG